MTFQLYFEHFEASRRKSTRKKLLAKLQESHSHTMIELETARIIWFWPGLKNKIEKEPNHAADA